MELQPLRIEAGWQVDYNQFYEVDPAPGYEHYFEGSSLLILQSNSRLKLIDVQWRPEKDLEGEYQVEVLNFLENFNTKTNEFDIAPNWENPSLTFSTKSRINLVHKLEELMRILPVYEDPRITEKRGIVDELSEAYRLELLENGISTSLAQKILKNGNPAIQNHLLDRNELPREIILMFAEKGSTKKVRNKAKNKLYSKRFKN
jgi:hypothetical protein